MTSADDHSRDHSQQGSPTPPAGDPLAPDRQHALLRQVLDINPNLIFVKDRDGRFALANRAVADIYGTTVQELIGKTDADFNPNAEEVARFRRDDLEVMDSLRERVIDEEVVTDARGVEHVLHTVKRPILDPTAGPTGRAEYVLGVAVDVTERKRTEEAYRFLAEAGAALTASLDYETTLANVVRMAVPAIADWCGIDMLEHSGELRRIAMFHQDEEKLTAAREMHERYQHDAESFGARLVMNTGQPSLVARVDDDSLRSIAVDEKHLQWLRELELTSYMCVPLEVRGRAVAALSFAMAESRRTYTADDLLLAMELARRAAVAIDNTMLLRAQRETERHFRAMVEQVTDHAIFMVDPEGRATTWNEGVLRVLGYDEDEFIGLPIDRLFTSEDRTRGVPKAELREAAASGRASDDRWMLRRDGSRFWASGTTTALRQNGDETDEKASAERGGPAPIIGFAKVMRDLTEQKLSEAELDRRRQRLEQLVAERTRDLDRSHEKLRQADRMAVVGSLSAGLGHDLGNLLLPIQIRLEALESRLVEASESPATADLRDGRPTSVLKQCLEDLHAIRSAAHSLKRLSNGLRLLARDPDETPSLGPMREAVELVSWWEDVESLMKNALPRGVVLEGSFASNLPAVRMPRHHLTQAAFNLVQNAGDAMGPHGEGKVVVSASPAASGGDRVELIIADNGPGMTDEARRRCLEPFYSTKTRGISTGLGLTMVHGLVERAEGSLEIESRPGRGTRVVLNLPAGPRQTGRRDAASEPHFTALLSIADPRMRTYIASIMRSLGLEVMMEPPPVSGDEAPQQQEDPRLKIWVADSRVSRGRVSRFLESHPARRAVLMGEAEGVAGREDSARIATLSERPKTAEIWRALRDAVHTTNANGNGNGNGRAAGAKGRA